MVEYRVEFAKGDRRAPFAAGQPEEPPRHMARHQRGQFLNLLPAHGFAHEPVKIGQQIFPAPPARRGAKGAQAAIARQFPEQVAPQLRERRGLLDRQQQWRGREHGSVETFVTLLQVSVLSQPGRIFHDWLSP